MIQRTQLNKLVVATLEVSPQPQCAHEIFYAIARSDPKLLRVEKVRSFRGFVKILNTFRDVRAQGTGLKQYSVEKQTLK